MSKKLKDIRKKIDQIDHQVHDLLMQRAELVLQVGDEKRKSNLKVVQPEREAMMINRLLDRHKGPLPREATVRIWRELVGAVSLLQTGLKVVVTVPDDHTGLTYWDMAKDYFSSVLPMHKASNALGALAMVREGEATFAVLPWPDDDMDPAWWSFLIGEEGDNAMHIMARLPLGDRSADEPNPQHRALVVARVSYEPSDSDRSFIAVKSTERISRAGLLTKIESAGLTARSAYSTQSGDHIVEVDSYVAPGDAVLDEIANSMDCPDCQCICIGGYPVPPIYADKVGKNAVSKKQTSNKTTKK